MKYIILLLCIALSGCTNRAGQYYVQQESVYINTSKYTCYKGKPAFTENERLAYCDTAKECQEICDKARLQAPKE